VLQGREGTNEEASSCRRDVDKDGREGFLCYRGGGLLFVREHHQGFFRNWNRTLVLSFRALVIVVVLSYSDTL